MLEKIFLFFKGLFIEIKEFFTDLFLLIFESVLGAVAAILELLPSPEFFSDYQLADYIPDMVGYLLVQSSFPEALLIVGAGYTFKMIKKLVTLGIL